MLPEMASHRPPLRLSDEDAIDVGDATDLYELLRAIDEAMPNDAILYLEGTSIAPGICEFLAGRAAAESPDVEPNTVWPKPRFFHLPLTGSNLGELQSLAKEHAEPEVADHLVVHRRGEVLLWAHDAGAGRVHLCRSLSPETIEQFRTALGATAHGRGR